MVREPDATHPEQPQFEKNEFYFLSRALTRPKFPNKANEDSHFTDTDRSAYGVFDGMGGYEHSKIAAEIARSTIQKFVVDIPAEASEAAILQAFRDAYASANTAVRYAATERKQKKLGTTATTVLFRNIEGKQRALFAHIGDSRLYRFRSGKLELLTQDHGPIFGAMKYLQDAGYDIQQLMKQVDEVTNPAKITDPVIKGLYEGRHNLSRYIGQHEHIDAAVGAVDVTDGDMFILTTDGLTDNLTFSQIEQLARENHNPAMLIEMIEGSARHVVTEALKREELAIVDGGSVEIKKQRTSRAKMDDMTGVVIAAYRIG